MDNVKGHKEFIAQLDKLKKAMRGIPAKVGAEAVLFSKERFQKQNWYDTHPEPWKPRKHNKGSKQRKKRGTLTDSGRLRRGTRKAYSDQNRVLIRNPVPYAAVHNKGLQVNTTQRVSRHKRGPYRRKGTKVEEHTVRAHKRKMNFKMPQRQFMGESRELTRRYENLITNEFEKVFKQ